MRHNEVVREKYEYMIAPVVVVGQHPREALKIGSTKLLHSLLIPRLYPKLHFIVVLLVVIPGELINNSIMKNIQEECNICLPRDLSLQSLFAESKEVLDEPPPE